ncbi:hypothetical protein Scep_023507 [Stephania cephalantha]|uniref:Uncharacterized protein n=1 Tax=Stephania cephalantha TaxID=152367 RepID=A0AAP0HWC3_9MAGN
MLHSAISFIQLGFYVQPLINHEICLEMHADTHHKSFLARSAGFKTLVYVLVEASVVEIGYVKSFSRRPKRGENDRTVFGGLNSAIPSPTPPPTMPKIFGQDLTLGNVKPRSVINFSPKIEEDVGFAPESFNMQGVVYGHGNAMMEEKRRSKEYVESWSERMKEVSALMKQVREPGRGRI